MEHDTRNTREWFSDWANEYGTGLGKIKRHHALLDLAVITGQFVLPDGAAIEKRRQ